MDRDGLKDLIVGEKNGYVYFYDNVGTNAAPVFNTVQRLSTQSDYIVDGLANPHIHFNDWDEDGDLDLVFGERGPYNGYIRVYLNLTNSGVNEEHSQSITQHQLSINPNPMTNYALIQYTLNKSSLLKVEILSSDGRLVASPINQHQEKGEHQIIWNGNDDSRNNLPNGVYFVRFVTSENEQVKRVTLLK